MGFTEVSTLVDDLNEDDALAIVNRIAGRFGWKATVITRDWAEQVWKEETDPFTELTFSDFVWDCLRQTKEFQKVNLETHQVQTTALYEAVARVRQFLNGEL
jgi:hypothetical protein